jgi:phosphoglycolate phosphatase
MTPSVLLLDLDGTLTDSRPGIVRCMRHALDRLGVSCPPDDVLGAHVGTPLRTAFGTLLNTREPAPIAEALALYRERYAVAGLYENAVYPAIPETLDHLARRARLYVATPKLASGSSTTSGCAASSPPSGAPTTGPSTTSGRSSPPCCGPSGSGRRRP